jgi:hypothetical protein
MSLKVTAASGDKKHFVWLGLGIIGHYLRRPDLKMTNHFNNMVVKFKNAICQMSLHTYTCKFV